MKSTLVFFKTRPDDLNINRTVYRTAWQMLDETGKFNVAEVLEWINNQLAWRIEDGKKIRIAKVTEEQVRLRILNQFDKSAYVAKNGAWYIRQA